MKRFFIKGFTLIELLTVLATIAILISILTPALFRARESARRVVCKSLMRNYTLAHYSYFIENDDLLPISVNDPIMRPWHTYDEFRGRIGLHEISQEAKQRNPLGEIQEYSPSYPKKYICPSATYALKNPKNGLYPMDRSYGLNSHVYYFRKYVKERMLKQNGRIICMADSLDWWFNHGGSKKYTEYGEQWQGFDTYGMVSYRHFNQKANVSFWDGRCEQMTTEQLQERLYEWMLLAKRLSEK